MARGDGVEHQLFLDGIILQTEIGCNRRGEQTLQTSEDLFASPMVAGLLGSYPDKENAKGAASTLAVPCSGPARHHRRHAVRRTTAARPGSPVLSRLLANGGWKGLFAWD